MPYRDRDRRNAYSRAWMQGKRATARVQRPMDRVQQYNAVEPYRHRNTLPKALIRWLQAHGIPVDSLERWETLRDLLLGLESPPQAQRRDEAKDQHIAWLEARVRTLEQENAALQDALAQVDRHAAASRRIIREQAASYDSHGQAPTTLPDPIHGLPS